MTDTTDHEEIIGQCCSSIQSKYSIVDQPKAMRRLSRELNLIQQHGFTPILQGVLELTERLASRCNSFRLIGSGGASFVNYLLGLSEFNPVRYRLPCQRFWLTTKEEAPTFTLVVDPNAGEVPGSTTGIKIHGMTPREAIPYRLKTIEIPENDQATFKMLAQGDAYGVFQFEADTVREVANRFRPTTVRELAAVTSLALREQSDPELAVDFLKHRNLKESAVRQDSYPRLFQEELMFLLKQRTALSWSKAYLFTKESAKNNGLPVGHPLYQEALRGASTGGQSDAEARQFVEGLARESRSADCLAHHLSNAITTYRAAYLKKYFPGKFQRLLEEIGTEV